ncbi:MAG: tetratricopeptide repeat protein [Candidatus Glassbacteria bacterium]
MRYFLFVITILTLCIYAIDAHAQKKIRSAKVALESAKIYIKYEKWNDALVAINQGLEQDPNHAELYMLLGRVSAELEDYAKSDTAFKKAFELDISLKDRIEKTKQRFLSPLMRDGLNAINEKNLDEAEAIFKNVVALCPERSEGYINLGIICYDKQDYECAVKHFKRARSIDPRNEMILKNLALTFSLTKQPDSALSVYRELLAIKPEDFDTRNSMATLLLNIGRYEDACNIYDSLLSDEVDDVNTLYNSGVAYAQVKQFEKAKDCFEKVLSLSANDVDAMVNLSMIYMQLNNYEGAIPVLENLTKKEPENAEYWSSLAVAYMQVGRESEAETAYSKYKELTGEK